MAHRIDASEHGTQAVSGARAHPSATQRPAPSAELIHLHPPRSEPQARQQPLWHKDNYGFWLTVCILISVAFSIVYRAIA